MKHSSPFKWFLLTVLLSALPLAATAYDFMVDGLAYNINDDGTSVTVTYENLNYLNPTYTNLSGALTIPANVAYEGITYTITSIGENAFWQCISLTSVTIPNTVTFIGNRAFDRCENITSISIPNSVTKIDYNAFIDCKSLSSIEIPSSVDSIGNGVFRGCSSLELVKWNAKSCNDFTSRVFDLNNSIISVIFGDEVEKIPAFLCYDLSNWTGELRIPKSVSSIGDQAFWDCYGLDSIVVEENNPTYDSRDNCNAIIETATNTLITGCKSSNIPNTVTAIGDGAFRFCSDLLNVTIPNSVTVIGKESFWGCNGLTSINIPGSVSSIGNMAFNYCLGLESIVVEDSNSYYDSRDNCNAIIETASNALLTGCKNTTIPNSVKTINDRAFTRCADLYSIDIPNSVTKIGIEAFVGCTGLTTVTFPNSVVEISELAFNSCSNLAEIIIPSSVSLIGYYAFSRTPWLNNQPDGLVYAGSVAYVYKGTMPEGTHIILKEDTKSITTDCFYRCSGLESVTIPNSVFYIGDYAFSGCTGLTRIDAYPNPSDVTLGDYVFSRVNENPCELHVLSQYVEAYREADQWKDFINIVGDLDVPVNQGDVNGDGRVNVSDVTSLVNMILGVIAKDEQAADINKDGKVNVSDVTALVNIILGIK